MKHSCKTMTNMMKEVVNELGCKLVVTKKNSFKIYSPDGKRVHTFHIGEKGIHPLRRFIKTLKNP